MQWMCNVTCSLFVYENNERCVALNVAVTRNCGMVLSSFISKRMVQCILS